MQFYSDSFYYHVILHQSDRSLPYLLMLHGFMGSGQVFDHLTDGLKLFCNPITIDLAGHGKTESPDNPEFYKADRQVNQLASIIRRMKFDNLYLYGYSMGGRLAFQLLASRPEFFSGAIIESSHCGIESKEEQSSRKKLDEKRSKQIANNFENFIKNWNQLPLFKNTPNELKAVYEDIMRSQNPKNMAASLRGFGTGEMPYVCDKIKNTNLPITLIAGELDQKYVNIMSELERTFESADLYIVEKAGHRVHTDQPNELIRVLQNILTKN